MSNEAEDPWDISRIRPDVAKVLDKFGEEGKKHHDAFLSENADEGVHLSELGLKLAKGTELFSKGENTVSVLTMKEQEYFARYNRYLTETATVPNPSISDDVKCKPIKIDGVRAEWQYVPGGTEDCVLVYIHGGAFVWGSPNSHRWLSTSVGQCARMNVLSIDYRLAPEHPHPAPLDDCITVYKWLLSKGFEPGSIVLAGDSAGGNLALTSLIQLRNENVPLPGAAICLSPITDLTYSGESFTTNKSTDFMVATFPIWWLNEAHLAGTDPRSPLVSPLFADLSRLPPILFQVSSIEMLYDDSKRLVEKAKLSGVDARLEEWNDMLHVFQTFSFPESEEALAGIRDFVDEIVSRNQM